MLTPYDFWFNTYQVIKHYIWVIQHFLGCTSNYVSWKVLFVPTSDPVKKKLIQVAHVLIQYDSKDVFLPKSGFSRKLSQILWIFPFPMDLPVVFADLLWFSKLSMTGSINAIRRGVVVMAATTRPVTWSLLIGAYKNPPYIISINHITTIYIYNIYIYLFI